MYHGGISGIFVWCVYQVCVLGSRNSTPKMLISCCQENRGLIKLRDYLEKNPWRFIVIIPQGWGYLEGNVAVSRPLGPRKHGRSK